MKEFIRRNSPVFVIGIITGLIFVVITVISQFKEYYSPKLLPVSDFATQQERPTEELPNIPEVEESTPGDYDAEYGVLEIIFTDEGFEPTNTQANKNQLVRWANNTPTTIYLEQITNTYDELVNQQIEIKPGKYFEFRVTETKMWIYKEVKSDNYGSIFVLD